MVTLRGFNGIIMIPIVFFEPGRAVRLDPDRSKTGWEDGYKSGTIAELLKRAGRTRG